MRDRFVVLSLVCFGPIALMLLSTLMTPQRSATNFGPIWWLMFPAGLIGLTGIFSLTAFCWDGSRPLKTSYLRITVASFLVFIVSLCVKAGVLGGGGASVMIYYAGAWGFLLLATLYLPLLGTVILVWSARRYLFGSLC